MTEKQIKNFLLSLNRGKPGGYVVARPLSDKVEYAKVWLSTSSLEDPKLKTDKEIPYTFYFLRDKEKEYAAAVRVSENNLTWYLLPEARKGNLFSDALKETILPHILQRKPVQRLELNRTAIGEKAFLFYRKIALAAGFSLIKEKDGTSLFAIEANSLEPASYISGKNTGISKTRSDRIKVELQTMIQKLDIIRTEIIMKAGSWAAALDYEKIIAGLKAKLADPFRID